MYVQVGTAGFGAHSFVATHDTLIGDACCANLVVNVCACACAAACAWTGQRVSASQLMQAQLELLELRLSAGVSFQVPALCAVQLAQEFVVCQQVVSG